MELTESWREVFPADIVDRFLFSETRNAAVILKSTQPEAFADIVEVLSAFKLTLDTLTTPGGSKSVIAKELDDSFRQRGWRESRFEQELSTRLTMRGWKEAPDPELRENVTRESKNFYDGHWVDNVKGRAVLDVEWNPKDGNLDRDLGNYVSLYESGIIDAGVIVTRGAGDFRERVRDLISEVRDVSVDDEFTEWHKRLRKLARDPYGTSTTANFEKLVPRIERGDGRGCPILAVGIPFEAYTPPTDGLIEEVKRLAVDLKQGSFGFHAEISPGEDDEEQKRS